MSESRLKRLYNHKYFPRIIVILILLLLWLAYMYFAYHDTYSNDSYVYANIVNITSQVSGPISKIYIKDNQYVKKGQKLIQLDPRPYEYTLEHAKSRLLAAKIAYKKDANAVKAAKDRVDQALTSLKLSEDHLTRYKKVQQSGGVAMIKIIDLESTIRSQESALASSQQSLQIAQENLNDADIKAAESEVLQAQYNLNHTTITAPTDGYITNFQLTYGQYIKQDVPLFALVESDKWWIITRYRETVLRKIHIGDKVRIHIDMYPGKVFHGYVQSIAWGINREQASNQAAPSTLAYLEATEDWIRIAQRFPVRIVITDASKKYPLRVGASARTIVYE